uniref:Uncharacterized protein n=1 Tax=Pelagomonas calceolata TaxID=35677 RepID=A0A7S3ZRY7_9STRA
MAPPFRARACWAPARSAAEAADELRLRLAEARDALEEQRREHARLRKVKRAFEANLELRTRELELVVNDLNRCRRGAIARTSAAAPPAQMGGSAENRRVAVEALAGAHGRVAAVERRLRRQATARVGLEGTLRDADVAAETARVERAYAEAARLLRFACGSASPPASGAASSGRRAQAKLPPRARDARVEAAYGGRGMPARPVSAARRRRDDNAQRSDCALAGDAAREAARLVSLRDAKKKKKDERVRAKRTRAAEAKKRRLDAEFRRARAGIGRDDQDEATGSRRPTRVAVAEDLRPQGGQTASPAVSVQPEAVAEIPPFNAKPSRSEAIAEIPPFNAKPSRSEAIAEIPPFNAKPSRSEAIAEIPPFNAKPSRSEDIAATELAKSNAIAAKEAEKLARIAAERAEVERNAAEQAERAAAEGARLEAGRLEADRREAKRLETEHLEAKRVEAEHVAAAKEGAKRLAEAKAREAAARHVANETKRLETERLATEEATRLEAERLEAERAEAERRAAEERRVAKAEAERTEAERAAGAETEEAENEAEAAHIVAENLKEERAVDEASWGATTDGDDDDDEQDSEPSEADTNNDDDGAWE